MNYLTIQLSENLIYWWTKLKFSDNSESLVPQGEFSEKYKFLHIENTKFSGNCVLVEYI